MPRPYWGNWRHIAEEHGPGADRSTWGKRTQSQWAPMVNFYTARVMTDTRDRLHAIAGIAQRLGCQGGARYLHGLWEGALLEGTCWRCVPSDVHYQTHLWTRSDVEGCPSWSWGSVASRVSFFGPVADSHRPLASVRFCESGRCREAASSRVYPHLHVQGQLLHLEALRLAASSLHGDSITTDPRKALKARMTGPGRERAATEEALLDIKLDTASPADGLIKCVALLPLFSPASPENTSIAGGSHDIGLLLQRVGTSESRGAPSFVDFSSSLWSRIGSFSGLQSNTSWAHREISSFILI